MWPKDFHFLCVGLHTSVCLFQVHKGSDLLLVIFATLLLCLQLDYSREKLVFLVIVVFVVNDQFTFLPKL